MKTVGQYNLISKLGNGEYGVVYKGINTKTQKIFALKAINKERVKSNAKLFKLFQTELAVMSKLKHPNILHLYEYLETSNNFYLVIDYCNNGDLLHHVTKNQYLGEEESIYFLMQIMNGFRELHKYKIMHRDFKLANIFLNDDKVVIGDFGFAKSGSEMASTKLGSPITMAPELLNMITSLKYTNKADLWSVGVCFFHMIFGKAPWTPTCIPDLQMKVMHKSGKNLKFPKSPKISEACKDLLRRLIEPDPEARIEWYEFFGHELFEAYMSRFGVLRYLEEGEIVGGVSGGDMSPGRTSVYGQMSVERPGGQRTQKGKNFGNGGSEIPGAGSKTSVMFRNHEDKVTKLFAENKRQSIALQTKKVDLVDPLQIDVEGIDQDDGGSQHPPLYPKHTSHATNQAGVGSNTVNSGNKVFSSYLSNKGLHNETEAMLEKARNRYVHQKQIITFCLSQAKEFRNLSKMTKKFKNNWKTLMYSAILLLKKGIALNERMSNTFRLKINLLRVEEFEKFQETENSKKIQLELLKDNKFYYTMLTHLHKKMHEEIGFKDPQAIKVYRLSIDCTAELKEIDDLMRLLMQQMMEFYYENSALEASVGQEFGQFVMAVAGFYLCVESETEFAYCRKDGIPFDWKQFYDGFQRKVAEGILERGLGSMTTTG